MSHSNGIRRKLLVCGPIGCALFVLVVWMQGIQRADYSSLRFPVSSLSIGSLGWIQRTNFVVTGSLIILCSAGLMRVKSLTKQSVWLSRLPGLVGIGLVGAGFAVSDPVYGYPATAPLALAQFTLRGHLHDFFSLFVFISFPVACFKFRTWFKTVGKAGWATYSFWSGISFLLTFVLTSAGFKQVPVVVDMAGLWQRICLLTGFAWLSAVAVYLMRQEQPVSKAPTGTQKTG